ncbi:MAG: c-type cytochrome [Chitinophagaceae bacterium]|nr:MAG: cytochrome C [Bacteroidetes bacterium OLB11]MCC6447891.1 c-type cytochrome [Chitinophagaceae bacterium]HMN32397.1 c-type cytochrome [Chitinophagaceae bacterium]
MKKKLIIALLFATPLFFVACGGGESTEDNTSSSAVEAPKEASNDVASYDPQRGEGKFDASNVKIGALDAAMATKGKAISETKCFSCHKLSDEKLVGPGWKGVTSRREPHWIMNFITNPDAMIDKDPEVQAQLELCLVRMPNQNLADEEAREIVEFMRQNDGVK